MNSDKEKRDSLNPKREKGPQKEKHPNQYGEQSEEFGIGKEKE
ncbi:hypothetical protein ACFQO1_07525 [Jejudonia soesokkakensis]|uniref:3-methyladenine DNA glycosylase n=1 Tax=Jejudonia soesokkakensis TaxID=1323432 RepID=A0ABW2MUF5_9FLAO